MNDPQPMPAKLLATPVQYLKGVGPERAELLQRLELHTVADVLFYFPRDYQDFTDEREIGRLEEGKLQTVRGVVDDIELRTSQSGRAVLGVLIRSRNRLSTRTLVQPTLHAGKIRLWPARGGLGQAQVRRADVADASSPRGNPCRG